MLIAALYPDPFARFFISPNKPNTGGKVFFYINGTTTLKNTWSDPLLTIPNTNPLILNSNGNFKLQIFANDADVFSIEVKDANDVVTQPTIDDVSFVSEFALSSADTLASLAANSAAVVINGASMSGSAFGSFADNLDLTAAGSIDASAGAITLGIVSGPTTFDSGNLTVAAGDINIVNSSPVVSIKSTSDGNTQAVIFKNAAGSLRSGISSVVNGLDATLSLRVAAQQEAIGIASDLVTTLRGDVVQVAGKTMTFSGLAGTGTRNVVVDANGLLSAP